MNIEQWLGKDNKLGQDIWHKKYQYDNETFDDWLDRVSGGNEAVKRLIIEKKFLFGGRILANRNIPGNKTYSNCYVITPPEDNLESIFSLSVLSFGTCPKEIIQIKSSSSDKFNFSPINTEYSDTLSE